MQKVSRLAFLIALTATGLACGPVTVKASADQAPQRSPLVGRVEIIGAGASPELPADLFKASQQNTVNAIKTRFEPSGSLPLSLQGEWIGEAKVTQVDIYPELHQEPYCQQFMSEVGQRFHKGMSGEMLLKFQPQVNGAVTLTSSDINLPHGLRVMLTSSPEATPVSDGVNRPRPLRNEIKLLSSDRAEQTRIDYVRIVDSEKRLLHAGFTEISALYQILNPKRLRIKILDIDYDQAGKPLWKILMEGEARPGSKH